jgi:hypothetical protein
MVPNVEEKEGENDHDHNGPKVDQLGGENSSIPVGENSEIVAFYIEECENDVCGVC